MFKETSDEMILKGLNGRYLQTKSTMTKRINMFQGNGDFTISGMESNSQQRMLKNSQRELALLEANFKAALERLSAIGIVDTTGILGELMVTQSGVIVNAR